MLRILGLLLIGVGSIVFADETRTTKTGHVFTRDTSQPKLGEAWRDPSGMIWGDYYTTPDGKGLLLSHAAATEYCKGIGAVLPSRADIWRLREYMGAKKSRPEPSDWDQPQGFEPQVLRVPKIAVPGLEMMWTSTRSGNKQRQEAYQYVASQGETSAMPITKPLWFRCVVGKRK